MYLNFKIKCPCGAKFEINNNHPHEAIACPNCGKTVDDSKNICHLLETALNISVDTDPFSSNQYSFSVSSEE